MWITLFAIVSWQCFWIRHRNDIQIADSIAEMKKLVNSTYDKSLSLWSLVPRTCLLHLFSWKLPFVDGYHHQERDRHHHPVKVLLGTSQCTGTSNRTMGIIDGLCVATTGATDSHRYSMKALLCTSQYESMHSPCTPNIHTCKVNIYNSSLHVHSINRIKSSMHGRVPSPWIAHLKWLWWLGYIRTRKLQCRTCQQAASWKGGDLDLWAAGWEIIICGWNHNLWLKSESVVSLKGSQSVSTRLLVQGVSVVVCLWYQFLWIDEQFQALAISSTTSWLSVATSWLLVATSWLSVATHPITASTSLSSGFFLCRM